MQALKVKPAFPLFYLTVFTYTVASMFYGYYHAAPPPALDGVIGQANRGWVQALVNFYAFMICIYIVIYYARIEILEHGHEMAASNKKVVRVIEFALRLMTIGVVALKIISYHALEDLFVFSAILCGLLSIWLIFIKLAKYANIPVSELIPSILVFIISIWATYISKPEVQSQNVIAISVFSFAGAFALCSCIFTLAQQNGKQFYNIALNFLSKW